MVANLVTDKRLEFLMKFIELCKEYGITKENTVLMVKDLDILHIRHYADKKEFLKYYRRQVSIVFKGSEDGQ
jgi:hypothetical protein